MVEKALRYTPSVEFQTETVEGSEAVEVFGSMSPRRKSLIFEMLLFNFNFLHRTVLFFVRLFKDSSSFAGIFQCFLLAHLNLNCYFNRHSDSKAEFPSH